MSDKGENLAEEIIKINKLAEKYEFNLEDRLLLMDRLFLLGEACAFLQDLGLFEALEERYSKSIKDFMERSEEEMRNYERG